MNCKCNGLFCHAFCTKTDYRFSICYIRMPSIWKTNYCADRSILALPSAYQDAGDIWTEDATNGARARPVSTRVCFTRMKRVKVPGKGSNDIDVPLKFCSPNRRIALFHLKWYFLSQSLSCLLITPMYSCQATMHNQSTFISSISVKTNLYRSLSFPYWP